MSTTNSILFLHVSRPEQLDAAVLLEARGYTVKTVVDAHQLLRENEFAFTARNIRWGTSHVMMMCHFNVLHPEMEAVDAIRTIAHARCLGAHCIHMDELAFTSALMTQERLDGYDLAGELVEEPTRVRRALLCALREWGTKAMDTLQHWHRKADAMLGDSLKNPMVREQQRAQYRQPDKLSTTG
jgi:hypothetical protein